MAEDLTGGDNTTILESIASILSEIKDKMGKKNEKSPEDKAREEGEKKQKKLNASVDRTADSLIKLGAEFGKITEAGIKLAESLGTTATRGVQQEYKNRTTIFKQIFSSNADTIMSAEQLQSAQKSLTDTFISTREGYEVSADGAKAFGNALKSGFKSDFKLTGEAMRSLITAGVSTQQGFEQLRKATGRASLSETQLATLVNKNSLSFMLYGPRFAKAAAQAEKLGISLAQVQSAQESMVTNLDGTMDTVAQINQLGGQIDFGTLTQLNEFQGPEATLKYLQSTIPPALFQSASTRALLKGFGISVEDLMKRQGSAQDKAATSIEQSLTQLEEPVNSIAKFLTELQRRIQSLTESFGGVIKATILVGASLYALIKAGGITGLKALPGNIFKKIIGLPTGGGGADSITGAVTGPGTPGAGPGPTPAGGSSVGSMFEKMDAKKMLAGAAAMVIVATALYVTAKAVQEFMKVDWKAMGMAGVALLGLVGAVAAIGAIMSSGVGAVAILAGAAAMAVMGGALFIVGKAVQQFVPLIDSFGNFTGKLGELNGTNLLKVAGALVLLGPALFIFAGGLVAASLASLLGGGIITKITALSTASAGIVSVAVAFKQLNDSLRELNGIDTKKLKEISDFSRSTALSAAIGNITAPFSAIADRIRGTPAGGAPTAVTSNVELIRKIDQLVTVLNNAKTTINIDNKVQTVPRPALVGVNVTRNERV